MSKFALQRIIKDLVSSVLKGLFALKFKNAAYKYDVMTMYYKSCVNLSRAQLSQNLFYRMQ